MSPAQCQHLFRSKSLNEHNDPSNDTSTVILFLISTEGPSIEHCASGSTVLIFFNKLWESLPVLFIFLELNIRLFRCCHYILRGLCLIRIYLWIWIMKKFTQ